VLSRFAPEPVAAKVPEIAALFWTIKILTTAGGEATSDWLSLGHRVVAGLVEAALVAIGLLWQFHARRYVAVPYWFLAYAIAIFGTGVSDALHLELGIPYAGTTLLWSVVLATIFVTWHRSERTLSIHSIVTRRRECFYWSTVFATFALGTALGDLTATTLGLGYLASGILFTGVILVPYVAWRFLGLNAVVAFWSAYIVTRPVGASFADYISKAPEKSGLGFGDGPTALVFTVAVAALVAFAAVTRNDIQRPETTSELRSVPGGRDGR
jgi:uncharacterized membrane-anchored protein